MVKNGETLLMNGYFTVINGDFMGISLIETIVSNGK
jgi:hypothetical protein